ncbi:MAG: hypothetical protein GYA33_08075 [Thermogutta sp.]|nr:hypothetical protein [Thermogutta sp.]
MRVTRLALAVLLTIGLTGGAALAQPPGGPAGGRAGFGRAPGGFGFMGGGMGWAQLLQIEKVQKEIELTDDQKAEVEKIVTANREKMRELFGQGQGGDRRANLEKARELQQESQKKIEGVLLPHQVARLNEIRLQVAGVGALMDPDVRKELGLSEEQVQKLRDVGREVMQGMRPQDGEGPRDPGALRGRMQEMRQKMEEAAMKVLTDEQKSKWEKMKGEKFEISPEDLFPRRGGAAPAGDRPAGRRGARDT